MNSFGVMRAWTDVPEVPTIEPADLTPGTLEKVFETIAPSLMFDHLYCRQEADRYAVKAP